MLFVYFWWSLLVFYSLGFALETKEAEQQPSDNNDCVDFSKMVQKSKLEVDEENWSWLKEVDGWCHNDINSDVNQMCLNDQQEESSINDNFKEEKPMKCPAMLDDPKKNYELYKIELSDRFHKVMSGRLPENLTDIVFELIHNDMEFEQVLTVLERIREVRNKTLMLETEEEDFCETMTKQKCRRDSNLLVPQIQEFYDMILKTVDEEQKVREKRENSLWIVAEDYTKRINQYEDLLENEVHDEL
ncbi:uncharacterized protein [Drosophila kikkawai]|uniref:Uncharacterized protein n=1 Tax=Drosophila kikkawai TaxID=30033 RepID=A0A6P4HY17_DROKI|nr:uncharacterized protein LOC108070809 [Drosophila kikkawai]